MGMNINKAWRENKAVAGDPFVGVVFAQIADERDFSGNDRNVRCERRSS